MNIAKLTLLLFLAFPTSIAAGEKPSDIVKKFCELDFSGHRLNGVKYKKIIPLVNYPDEPSWDTAISIKSYILESEKIDGNKAFIKVKYQIIGSWPAELSGINKYSEELFELEKFNDEWKIIKYIVYPRVSSQVMCSEYKYCK